MKANQRTACCKTLRRAVLWLTTLLVLCYYKPVPKTGAQLNKRR